MNPFSAKKLGEVLAFTRVARQIFEKGQSSLEKIFGKNSLAALQQMAQEQETIIQDIAVQQDVLSLVQQKSLDTETNLSEMQDLYLQDKWDDETELLEWLGFFEGAALVHWKLVEGVAQEAGDKYLSRIVNKGLTMHQSLLFKVSEAVKRIGHSKAVNPII